jgi:hypothetical protein
LDGLIAEIEAMPGGAPLMDLIDRALEKFHWD